MKSFLARHWFLLLLFLGISLACLFPDKLRQVTDLLNPQWIISLALLLISMTMESRHLGRAAVQPWPAFFAVLVSYGFLPATAWLSGLLLTQPDLRLGLLISAAVPCTLASAVVWTRMAGGADAVALLVVVLTTCTSWLVTPAWLGAWSQEMGTGLHTSAMMLELGLVLIIPVTIGQLCRAMPPLARFTGRNKAALGVLAQVLILSIIIKAAVTVRDRLGGGSLQATPWEILAALGLCLANHSLAFGIGYGGGKFLGFGRPNSIAIGFSGSQKTLPVALVLFNNFFQETYPLAVVAVAFYHVGQLVVDTILVGRLKASDQPVIRDETGIEN